MSIFGYVYKMTAPDTDLCYIGSTIGSLCLRKAIHRYMWKNKGRFNTFTCSAYSILDKCNGNCDMEVIYQGEFDSIKDLRIKEREMIELYGDKVVNKNKPFITYEEKKEVQKDYAKKKYYENQDEYKQIRLNNYYKNKDYFREKYKQWYHDNREKRLEYSKQYAKNRRLCPECGMLYGCETEKHKKGLPHKNRLVKLLQNTQNE